jgi:deoxyadenosine/deoxycytidine kinase
MNIMDKESRIIALAGPTGVGKSSFSKMLGEILGGNVHEEKPEDNPYFSRFYDDLRANVQGSTVALQSQLHFLHASVEQLHAAALGKKGKTNVIDVPPQGHAMYAQLLAERGIISAEDYQLYQRIYNLLEALSPYPDVLVVVTVRKFETLFDHIKQRGRAEEQAVPKGYWVRQIQYWEEQLAKPNSTFPVVRVNVEDHPDWRTEVGAQQTWEFVANALLAYP